MLQHNFITRLDRLHQILLIGATLVASWLGMQVVHEFGHVLGAWLTGGRVERVVLHPLTVSRTDLAENPHPLIVAWAGPIIGAMLPFLIWVARAPSRSDGRCIAKHGWPGVRWFVQFFAGFCLIANGLYIGLGSFAGIGDCGDMLRHGSQRWQLWLFGIITAPLGLFLWHGLGPRLGVGATELKT